MTLTKQFEAEAKAALDQLKSVYGSAELEKPDKVLLMDGWNKILGWETMWKEACWFRWRILAAREELRNPTNDTGEGEDTPRPCSQAEAARKAKHLVEANEDPIGKCFGERRWDGKNMLLAIFDEQIRSLCPHIQVVQREAYRNIQDEKGAAFGLTLECNSAAEFLRLFSVCGIQPRHYLTLCEAFLWTMESHNPYAQDEDAEDFEKSPKDSAFARFVAEYVGKPGIKDTLALREEFDAPIYTEILPDFWSYVKHKEEGFGDMFYTNLLSNFPELLDYFARADMDSLTHHIILAIDLMTNYPSMCGEVDTSFRKIVEHLGEMHRELGIPTDGYPMIGMNLVNTLKPYFGNYMESTSKGATFTAEDIVKAVVGVYGPTMSFTFYPMLREEIMVQKATEFYETVAEEWGWSASQLSKRLLEVKLEISAHGTYQHTAEELQLGARLAWRNSVKCIGRISWNTLMVRDCRHVETPEGIIHEIEKHLELATAGTNLQSVMTVFRPRGPDEPWGIRFWTDQLVRYACYTDEDDPSKTIGDQANKHITKFLIEKKLWTPPEPRTQHDVLPIVFKMPGVDEPVVHQFDEKYVDESPIEHPTCPEIAKLGHKWASVPAINTFNMNLGGVDYGCIPFNGWFASVEIVRDLMERYQGCSEKWAECLGIDIKTHRMWKALIAHEMDRAILYSFGKSGYTIVDPETVGEQFLTHCKREREAGRECPGQWSWIGGLTGPINKTWHKEMRDFRLDPQYEYCCEMWSVIGEDEEFPEGEDEGAEVYTAETMDEEVEQEEFTVPRVLIAYGSETGTAEAAAGRLGRALRLCKPIITMLNKVTGLDIIKQRKITHLLVLCSTFGKGQPPSTAAKFVQTELPDGIAEGVQVAVLALGSSMYPDFCLAGKTVDKMLTHAGATKLAPLTTADEAVDSPGTVAQWIKLVKNLVLPPALEAAIEERMGGSSEPLQYETKWEVNSLATAEVGRFTWPEEQSSLCRINEELLVGGDINKRSTRRIGFDVPPGSSYVTGDHLAVNPLNSMDMVYRFAACFASEFKKRAMNTIESLPSDLASKFEDPVSADDSGELKALLTWQLQQSFEVDCIDNGQVYPAQLSFSTPTTLGEVLQSGVSLSISEGTAADMISVLKRSIPDDVPDDEDNEAAKRFNELSALILEGGKGPEHQDAMDSFLSLYPTVVDLLEEFVPIVDSVGAGVSIRLADVLAILPRLQPRLYSISSSSVVSPSVVEISVGVVHAFTKDGVHIKGVCSNYLASLEPMKDRVRVTIRTSSFRGPEDIVNTPMIMVGAGTGLAPMMGFLEDRAHALGSAGIDSNDVNCHLFFGCRNHDERMYRDKISSWEENDVLKLHLAMSRCPDVPKMYVQSMMKEKGKTVCDLLCRGDCTYYVCGDANMADFCYEAIIDALREHGRMSRAKAVQLLKVMRVEDRWQYDLWGISAYMDDNSYADAKKAAAKRKGNKALTWLSKMKRTEQEDDDF